jgi:hypothetical protein
MSNKVTILRDIYKEMSEEQRQEEIDAIFDIIYAILEATECDSIENYPNPNIRLRFSCDVITDQSGSIN